MPDDPKPTTFDLGPDPRDAPSRRAVAIDVAAAILTLAWLGAAAYFLLDDRAAADDGPAVLDAVLAALAVLMPVALIWVAALAARTARVLRAETAWLRAAIDAMRAAQVEHRQGAASDIRPSPAARHGAGTGSAAGTAARARAVEPGPPEPQPTLALNAPAEREPLSIADFIRAMNFPENEHDREGFRTLRRALEHPATERLIRAGQDALTLLSQDGIYMDDLRPDRARPEIWRKFAAGERGRSVAALGGVHDRSPLGLAAGRMKKDPVFRDAAHHFLRHFDRAFAAFEKDASDADIMALADTRTARAFMLLGRAAGTFD